jgi:hypothetical protein
MHKEEVGVDSVNHCALQGAEKLQGRRSTPETHKLPRTVVNKDVHEACTDEPTRIPYINLESSNSLI